MGKNKDVEREAAQLAKFLTDKPRRGDRVIIMVVRNDVEEMTNHIAVEIVQGWRDDSEPQHTPASRVARGSRAKRKVAAPRQRDAAHKHWQPRKRDAAHKHWQPRKRKSDKP